MKQLYIDALNGLSKRIDMMQCEKFAQIGIMEYCGNQWNVDYKFNQEFLNAGTEQQLKQMYEDLTNE